MVPNSVISAISSTFVVLRACVRARPEAGITGRVIERNYGATGDAWARIVWDEDVWFVMLG
jgi:hypothetical protein